MSVRHAIDRTARLARRIGLVAALATASCTEPAPFVCFDHADCADRGGAGRCESVGACSFPDRACPAGHRFGDLAAGDLAGACTPCAVELVAGRDFTCARLASGHLDCWGAGEDGQLGDGAGEDRPGPTRVVTEDGAPLAGVIAAAAGSNHACAVTSDGSLWCWGDNDFGELGLPTTVPGLLRARQVLSGDGAPLADIASVAAGSAHTCAATREEQVVCFGANAASQLGRSQEELSASAEPLAAPLTEVALLASGQGASHTCALRRDGSVWCWGSNSAGQLGDGTVENGTTPLPILPAGAAVHLAAAETQTCAVLADRSISCWGTALGEGGGEPVLTPRALAGVNDAARVAVGSSAGCALRSNGELSCWGSGPPLSEAAPSAPALVLEGDPAGVALGHRHACAIRAGQGVTCWGADDEGQLGDGTVAEQSGPVELSVRCE